MAQTVRPAVQNNSGPGPLQQSRKMLELENVRAARAGQSLHDLSGSQALQRLPKESLAKMMFYKPDAGGAFLPRAMAYPTLGKATAAAFAAQTGEAVPTDTVAPPAQQAAPAAQAGKAAMPAANPVYGANGGKGEASMLPKMEGQSGTEAYGGCKTCQSRTYQDGSDDAGVSFQTPTHIPASTAGIAVVSHEGEHVSRESEKAAQEGRIVTQKKVTTQMACCPECHKIYVAGGTTTISTRAAKNDSADAQSAFETLGGSGEQLDFET